MATFVQFTPEPPANEAYADSYKVCVKFKSIKPYQVDGLVGVYEAHKYCYTDDAFCIPAFFHSSLDERNGRNSFLFDFAAPILGGQNFVIQQFTGSWNNVGFFDNTTGVLYDFGAFPAYPNRSGFLIDWFMFQSVYGSGKFRLFLPDAPASVTGAYSPCFCVKEWACIYDHYVRIEIQGRSVHSNILWKGGAFDEPAQFDTSLIETISLTNSESSNGWYDSSFYRGAIGRHQNEVKTSNLISYFNNFNNKQYVVNVEKYELQVENETEDRIRRMRNYGLNEGSVIAHDFNKINSDPRWYRNLPVVYDSEEQTEYNETAQLVPIKKFTVMNRTDIEYINKR